MFYQRKLQVTPSLHLVSEGNFVEQSHFVRHYQHKAIFHSMLAV